MTLEQIAIHIEKLNREVGGILVSIEWIKSILNWQMGILGTIFIASITNIILTHRNGRKR